MMAPAVQPQVWREVLANTARSVQLDRLLALKDLRILLTGAGSSAYIGECLAPAILRRTDRRVEAVPATDLVCGPRRYFQRGVPTLMVSFERSDSGPEGTAAVRMADEFIDECHHLVLTCDEDGELGRLAGTMPHAEVIVMPRGARASSFTALLLAAARIFEVLDAVAGDARAPFMAGAQDVLLRGPDVLHGLAGGGFQRVIYVGSNELKGLAREGALNLLESTGGRVVASFDASLGFRHGHRSVIDAGTLIVLFVSNDPYTRKHDLALLHELRREAQAGRVVALFASAAGVDRRPDDFVVDGLAGANDIEAALAFALFAQMLAESQSPRRQPARPVTTEEFAVRRAPSQARGRISRGAPR